MFIGFGFESISRGPPFLKSYVALLHTTFCWPESSISNNYKANQNLYLQNIAEEVGRSKGLCSQGNWDVDRKKDQDRIWIISIKKLTIDFITSSLATIVYAGAFSRERKFEIIGHLQKMYMTHMGFKVNHQRNMTLKCLPAKISTRVNAHFFHRLTKRVGQCY